jgi:predicted phage-related endonuclease
MMLLGSYDARMKGRQALKSATQTKPYENRRSFIGGSDARIIMGQDEAALVRLWREKRRDIEPPGPVR